MIEPIVITEHGETLLGHPDLKGGDESQLFTDSTPVGIHEFCKGWVDLNRVALMNNALLCRVCKLRIIIPRNTVSTYGDLRTFFAKHQPALSGAT